MDSNFRLYRDNCDGRLQCCDQRSAQDQNGKIVLPRENRTIVLEPYGSGIVRITMSTSQPAALSAPGYGIVGTPSMSGWTHSQDTEGYDVIRSGELVVRVAPGDLPAPKHLPLDEINQKLRDIYFPPGNRRGGPSNDTITVTTAAGKPLLTMWRWAMFPNHRKQSRKMARKPMLAIECLPTLTRRPTSTTTAWGSSNMDSLTFETIESTAGTTTARSAARTSAFLSWCRAAVTVLYGITPRRPPSISDSISGTIWSSEVGDRVSFFVIAGAKTDEIYQGYRQLTGVTHLLPKAAYGYIQSKAIYPTQSRFSKLPRDIAIASCHWMFWLWTF